MYPSMWEIVMADGVLERRDDTGELDQASLTCEDPCFL